LGKGWKVDKFWFHLHPLRLLHHHRLLRLQGIKEKITWPGRWTQAIKNPAFKPG
tara:strand:+ start:339 stop:500 length:162 start_codon:yes stop_codon:yes gene_type:complete